MDFFHNAEFQIYYGIMCKNLFYLIFDKSCFVVAVLMPLHQDLLATKSTIDFQRNPNPHKEISIPISQIWDPT